MFIFGAKKKDPATLVKGIKENLQTLEKGKNDKVLEELSKNVANVKQILFGDPENPEPNLELGVQLLNEAVSFEIIPLIISNISRM